MKIKTKKQLNLPQLIEWGFENDIKRATYISENGLTVDFSFDGKAVIGYAFSKNDLFTIEVEEEIDENTVIPKLMTIFKKTNLERGIGFQRVRIDENYPIKLMLNKAEAHRESVETLHIVNDDGTHTLIWRDGKLVE